MKILVPVKRVLDANVAVRVKPDGSGVDLANLKMSMNPFDEIALEEAVRLKEAGVASDVVAVSIGPAQAQDTLRSALAMGADTAILVLTDQPVEPLAVARLLAVLVEREAPDLVIMGKQAIDDDSNQTAQMLSALVGWPQATFASKVEVSEAVVTVTREVDGGLETLELDLPAVISADLRLNTPRYASLPNVMKAKKKPLEQIEASELGIDLTPLLKILETRAPEARKPGSTVESVADLVERLKTEARVI
ncbi:electron transfer flavoprotein subunit beta/FixA family protein [Pelagibacterium montanilacus]|uniref:electron transfer flavoprotein subunit beta/FixA family protein n=1 Tax=Pelagibacterium montanilacus TaxID=2185280 RepID=UPI000F8CA772|nr:electron transfer flavoprotein subunit beta/FixA family protein [Pelagibacterium montanilacus]